MDLPLILVLRHAKHTRIYYRYYYEHSQNRQVSDIYSTMKTAKTDKYLTFSSGWFFKVLMIFTNYHKEFMKIFV